MRIFSQNSGSRRLVFMLLALAATGSGVSSSLAAQSSSGIDTPPSINALPFSIGGVQAMTLYQYGPTEYGLGINTGAAAPIAAGLDVNGDIVSATPGAAQLRLISGGYGAFWRNDGTYTWFLLTNENNPFGGWNNLYPLYINDKTGQVNFNQGINFPTTGTGITFSDGTVQTTAGGGKPKLAETVAVQSDGNTATAKTKAVHDICVLQHYAYWGNNQTSVTAGCTVGGAPAAIWTLTANTSAGNNDNCAMQCFDF